MDSALIARTSKELSGSTMIGFWELSGSIKSKGVFGNTPAHESTTGASRAALNTRAPRIKNFGALRSLYENCGASVSSICKKQNRRVAGNYTSVPPISKGVFGSGTKWNGM
jgi:hypothetical protein